MTAYRVVDAKGKVAKEYDDDGEAHGGQRLLGSLTKAKAVNVAVVVSRVYGGQNIGKARFEHICERAQSLLAEVGHVPGVGIQHSWGEGQRLGGTPAAPTETTFAAAPSSASRKRKATAADEAAAAAAAADAAAARRKAMAEAAERRMASLGGAASSQSS
uniref:Impact N-terminal domain-containing protein n=1 Tax=Prymnesium polylepis TaxID=72548 RepID=A0A7S4I1T0_9EUKA